MVIVHLSDTQRRIISPEKNETLEDLFKRFCSEFGYERAQYEFRSYPRDDFVPLDLLMNANRVKEVFFAEKYDLRRGSCDSCYTTIHEVPPALQGGPRKKISAPIPPSLPTGSDGDISKSRTKKRSAPRPPAVVEVVPTDSRSSTLKPDLSTPDIDIPPPPTSQPGPDGHGDHLVGLPYRSVECETDCLPRRPSNITQQPPVFMYKSDDTDNESATSPINFQMSVPCASQETLESLDEHFSGSTQMRNRDASTSSGSSVNDVYENEKWVRVTLDESDDGQHEQRKPQEKEREQQKEQEQEKERERQRERELENERERQREREQEKERERQREREQEKERERQREREQEKEREREKVREEEKERKKDKQPPINFKVKRSQSNGELPSNEIEVTADRIVTCLSEVVKTDISARNTPHDETEETVSTRSDWPTSLSQHTPSSETTNEQLATEAPIAGSRTIKASDVRDVYKQSRSKAKTVDLCSNIDFSKEDQDASESTNKYWDVTKQSKTLQLLSRAMHTTIDNCETSDELGDSIETRDKVEPYEQLNESHSTVEPPAQQVQRVPEPIPRAVRVIVQETAAVDQSGRPMYRPRQAKSLFFTAEPKQP